MQKNQIATKLLHSQASNPISKQFQNYLLPQLPKEMIHRLEKMSQNIKVMIEQPDSSSFKPKPCLYEVKLDDLSQMKSLLLKSIEASEKVKQKNCVFLIGKTGSGKSSMIHYIAGRKLYVKQDLIQKKEQDDQQQQDSVEDQSQYSRPFTLITDNQIEGFTIGHKKASQTKILNTLDIQGTVFVDTAGLMDTNGVIYDIANAVGLKKALCNAKSLKFLLIIQENTLQEGRCVALLKLLQEFLGFAQNLQIQKLLPIINIIISKNKVQAQYEQNLIKEIAKRPNTNDKILAVLKEMGGNIKRRRKDAKIGIIKRGTKGFMTSLDQSLKFRKQLIQRPRVQNQKGYFSVSLKQNSASLLKTIMTNLNREIKNLADKNLYEELDKLLDEIQYLKKYIETPQIMQGYDDCVTNIQESLWRFCRDYQRNLSLYMSEKGQLSEEALLSLKESLLYAQQADKLKIQLKDFQGGVLLKIKQKMAQKIKEIIQYIYKNIHKIKQMYSMIKKIQKIYFNFGASIQEIKKSYINFVKQMEEKVKQKINIIIKSVKGGDYINFSKQYFFINQIQIIFKEIFNFDLSTYQKQIVTFVKEAISLKLKQIKKEMHQKITESSIDVLKKHYQRWNSLFNNEFIKIFFGKQIVKSFINEIKSPIYHQLEVLQKDIDYKISSKMFFELQNPLLTYKKLRQIDNEFTTKTLENYCQVIQKINFMIIKGSKQIFANSIKKIRLGNITQEQLYILKDHLMKMKQISWLQKILEKESFNSTLANVDKIIYTQSKKMAEQLPNIFAIQIRQIEESIAGLDTFNFGSSYYGRDRLIKVNSMFSFLKSVSEINEKLKEQQIKAKEQIFSIINNRIQNLNSLIEESKISQLHKSQVGNELVILSIFRYVKCFPFIKIQNTLDNICKAVNNHLTYLIQNIKIKQLKQTEGFIKQSTKIIQLFNILKISSSEFLKKKICINQKKKQFMRIIQNKFEDFYQEFNKNLQDENLDNAKKALEILKKLRFSQINEQMDKIVKEKYKQISQKFQKYVSNKTNDVQKLLIHKKYQQFLYLLKQLEDIKPAQYRKLYNLILQRIKEQFQNIQQELSRSISQINFYKLNKDLRKFLSYAQIESFIQKETKYKEKTNIIINKIRELYLNMEQKIKQSIKSHKFKNIKYDLDNYLKIKQVLVKEISIIQLSDSEPNLKTQIQKAVQHIINTQINIKQYCNIIKKLQNIQEYDKQFQTFLADYFLEKIMKNIQNICRQCKKKSQNTQNIEEIYQCQAQIRQLNSLVNSGKRIKQTEIFLELITTTEKIIQQYGDALIFKCKYNNDYLQHLKKYKRINYNTAIKGLTTQFQGRYKEILNALEKQDYQLVYRQIKNLSQLFVSINQHIKDPKYTPKVFMNQIQEKIYKKNELYYNQILKQLKNKKIDNLTQFKKFFSLQIQSKGEINEKLLQKFHLAVVQYLKSVIPKSQNQFLVLLKNYVRDLQQIKIIQDKSEICSFLDNIQIGKEFDKKVYGDSSLNFLKNQLKNNKLAYQNYTKQILKQFQQFKNQVNDQIQIIRTGFLSLENINKNRIIDQIAKQYKYNGKETKQFITYSQHDKKLTIKMPKEGLNQIPNTIGNFAGLQRLKIQAHDKNRYKLQKLPDSFVRLKSLKQIQFYYCVALQSTNIRKTLRKLVSLQKLKIHQSPVTNLKNIQLPQLTQLELTYTGIKQFPDLSKFPNLKKANLQSNQITDVPAETVKLQHLQQLNISHNPLSTAALKQMFQNLQPVKTLKRISIKWMENMTQVPTQLFSFAQLQFLNLYCCKISSLPSEVANLQKLKYLNLQCCDDLKLSAEIGRLSSLVKLQLPQVSYLPPEIGKLKNLECLIAYMTKLSQLPNQFANLKQLKQIQLRDCKFTQFPTVLFSLVSLKKLDLSQNSITHLPSQIGNMKNLTNFDINRNKLKQVPKSLINLNKHTYINLKMNPLDAAIKEFLNEMIKSGFNCLKFQLSKIQQFMYHNYQQQQCQFHYQKYSQKRQ